ncbi:MAG: VWA domain-containing protein [Acidobacteria bacterium]|nr:VWA domain-containing protein [Acidobacteriota bacterium]
MDRSKKQRWLAVLFLLLFSGVRLYSGDEGEGLATLPDSGSESNPSPRPFRAHAQLVLVNVSVIDVYDRFVTGLQKENFQVYEDKKPQQIEEFSKEDVPISVGILFDASGSMAGKMEKARMAVSQFFRTANPADEFFLISFNNRPNKISDFTQDLGTLQDKLNFTETKGQTALLDAVYLGLHEMRNAQHSRKVLLIFSDGGDNHSRYTPRDIKGAVKEADVQIYAIGIYEPNGFNQTPEELAGPSLLNEIVEMTGGRQFAVENLNNLPAVASKVGREMRQLYVLGYSPTNKQNDGKWRKIQVKLIPPKGILPLQLFSKSGYYAPHY